ncbi:MAG: hypothetical protein AAGE43_02460 [Pseudomonadota bacterium]
MTLAWLLIGGLHISQDIGWRNFSSLSAAELGNFLEGAFAPLAFLWLVIGYFLQKKELEQNTLALQAQSEKMAETEFHARQEAFLQVYRAVRSQLGSIAGFLYISSQSAQADGRVTNDEQSRLFAKSGQDPELFSRRILEANFSLADDPQAQFDIFYGTPIRARHSNSFIYTFERLVARAEAVDPDQMIRDALLTGGHGLVYSVAKRFQDEAPPELADYRQTGLYFAFTPAKLDPLADAPRKSA